METISDSASGRISDSARGNTSFSGSISASGPIETDAVNPGGSMDISIGGIGGVSGGPVVIGGISSGGVALLEQKFKRDLNRVADSDRTTRKRGLQKLLEDLPWKVEVPSAEHASFVEFLNNSVLGPVIACIKDPTEKCRELSLQIMKEVVDKGLLEYEAYFSKLLRALCARINDFPFPEPTEELRLVIVEIMTAVLKSYRKVKGSVNLMDAMLAETVVKSVSKVITDNFPAVKKGGAELLHYIAKFWPESVRMSFSALLKPLTANALHQHNKTRTATLKALGACLSCIQDGYATAMAETVLPLLGRIAADRSASTRAELTNMCKVVLTHRIKRYLMDKLEDADVQLTVLILLLVKDAAPDVASAADEVRGVSKCYRRV
jgi:dynein assembly factor 5